MIKPVRNQIVFKPFEADNVSEGGILVPDSAKQVSNKGEIVAVGIGTKNKPMNLKPGTVGYRVKDWGTEIEYSGEKYFIMDADAIIAIN